MNDGTRKQPLQRQVRKRVKPGAAVITDELQSYRGLDQSYQHLVINHAEKYVDGQVHTDGLENVWSLLKRGLGGTYVRVRSFHLARYLDEQVFRYNEREGAFPVSSFHVTRLPSAPFNTPANLSASTDAARVNLALVYGVDDSEDDHLA